MSTTLDKGGYHIMTWGCQMNDEDSEQMGLYLEQSGYTEVSDPAQANVVLLNTCSVRAKPEEKVWSELGKLKEIKKERPGMIIGVCGCMAQVESVALKRRAPFIDMIVGTGNIASIPAMIDDVTNSILDEDGLPKSAKFKKIYKSNLLTLTALGLPERKGAIVTDLPSRNVSRRAKLKAHVPIMYGCDKFCTFCIVPHTRGRERSRPTDEILAEIAGLAMGGTREVTLLGQTVNSYGKNLEGGKVPFCDLLGEIDKIKGIQRIRFTSPYPRDFTDELISTIGRLPKVCEHVHLPLQVGDDGLLTEMHRGYTVEQYLRIVEKLRTQVPGIAITTDIMLGYPGETDQQFEHTMSVVRDIRFDAAFMFAYSPRPNTKAAAKENQLPQKLKIDRLKQLVEMQNGITCEVNQSMVGQTHEVLVEGWSEKSPDKLTGYTRGLKGVHITAPSSGTREAASLIGKTVPVRLDEGHLTNFSGTYVG